jgi:hypothetical protein
MPTHSLPSRSDSQRDADGAGGRTVAVGADASCTPAARCGKAGCQVVLMFATRVLLLKAQRRAA